MIFPFGINPSQKDAVFRALSSQVSIVEGPPGTGKTQTILNIIANIVLRGKTIALVSGNNSATNNVLEKLEKNGLDFICASLGNRENKEKFLENQSESYPDMTGWNLPHEKLSSLQSSITKLTAELDEMLKARNRVAIKYLHNERYLQYSTM